MKNTLSKSIKNYFSEKSNVAYSLQHVFAMFGATILIPMLQGIPANLGLLTAGIGTILFAIITKFNVPMFLGSSASYLGTFIIIKESMGINVAVGSFVGASFTYILVSFIIFMLGKDVIHKVLPKTLAGSVVIVLGLTLIPIALMLMQSNYKLGLIAIVVTIIFTSISKGLFKTIPILLSIGMVYIISIFMGLVDFSQIASASFIELPKLIRPEFNFQGIQLMAIVALVAVLEHVADLSTNGSIIEKDHFKETGLHRTLFGNGIAVLVGALGFGCGTTSYGENNGILAITKKCNTSLIVGAGVISIILSFSGKLTALINTIPLPAIGGVSFVLFGMLTMSGVNSIKTSEVNLMEFRNAVIVFVPLFVGVASIMANNPIKLQVSSNLVFQGLSLSALTGIILNVVIQGIDKIERKLFSK